MLSTNPLPTGPIMAATDKAFYKALGQRVAQRRRAMDLTQVELAKTLGIAQQTMAHYEGGSLRIPVALLPPLAKTLGTSIEDLVGEQRKPGKRGPAPKLQQKLEELSRLPKPKQKFVMEMIDTVLQQEGQRG
ncbi:MAG: helix-turn-helix domain-containing protein [Spiribacter salinus]|uniref:Helix-turn-helix domain-containing protein n=1 Tax=Spiribacter salinus TaxID=1335746 RepID=A0A540VD72_9GAMM|nr:MAG: helix-turn-helix domain-containing protein [Spiribacter salinus]